ncbi:complement factor I L homeolog precursor [Xenopus laevis]|uniref:Complement factor I L homeolog precursor n=1 Tax=Xenopus laevis TaxID=8355 RepID=Q03711_XENLA|nr:complement factor I L homeolog precursor [Xenopus laevis]CAA42582.1 Factor I C3b/C4b inactivator (serine protease) [Xenopus laevis]
MNKLCCVLILFCHFYVNTFSSAVSGAGDARPNTCEFNALSCHKVFCAPWQRCVAGVCRCKLPYQCPKNATTEVCTDGKRKLQSYCQLKSVECSNPLNSKYRFSSEAPCTETFTLTQNGEPGKGIIKVKLPTFEQELFLCGKQWSNREANVVCRQLGSTKGADASASDKVFSLVTEKPPEHCIQATCRGLENSLAECALRKLPMQDNQVAKVTCYTENKDCGFGEFTCSNGKCIPSELACDSKNDCGDLSDELCCKSCNAGFHCRSDTCIPEQYRCNGELDCIGGEDESNCTVEQEQKSEKQEEVEQKQTSEKQEEDLVQESKATQVEEKAKIVNYDIDAERRLLMKSLPELSCGVPPQTAALTLTRKKRVIGGTNAVKNQFPWQVAIKDGTAVNCGGIYIGGCWVLTAAHCVRSNQPQRYLIMLELLDRLSYDKDLDSFPVKSVIVHELYNPNTYENDIALLEVKNIYNNPKCMQADNNMVPACVPWSPFQFKAGDTCTVSGWGREKGMSRVFHLKWGHINLMDNCTRVYKERFLDKMECARTYDGSIDACKGDSGGPLVCYDVNKVAYVWGIVSWGENCGVPGYPGVYTKVANYFEWIAHQVGRSLMSKYNV